MADMGTMQIDSTRIPAEKPARAWGPKLFTTDCTSIMPMEMMDCCRMEGSAIFVISESSFLSKRAVFPQSRFRSTYRNTRKDSTAEMPWAIKVAQATPATPIWKYFTKMKSSPMLKREENIRKHKGILDFPRALNMEETTLYMNRKGSPRK